MGDIVNGPTYNPEGTVSVEFHGDDLRYILQSETLQLTEREVKDIQLCMFYAESLHHGADGHNRMMLVAKMAKALGIDFDYQYSSIGISGMFAGKVELIK